MNSSLASKFYHEMLRIRLVEEKVAELYPEQEMRCPVHLSIGQEAVAVGACAHLTKEDSVLSAHRSHAHYLAKGGNLKAMLAELYGKSGGCTHGKGGSMHLMDQQAGFVAATPIVASTIAIAVGVAMASVMQKKKQVTVVFFGEAATEEGTFHEAVNFAVLKKLPVVFICENNLYSVYSPLSVRQPEGRGPADLARANLLECWEGDGNDVFESYDLAGKAVAWVREGKGPGFVELKTYRWREHCGPNYDNHIGYRSEEEFAVWKKRCPIERLRQAVLADKIMTPGELDKIRERISAEIDEAVRFAKASPFPKPDTLSDHIYAS